VANGKSGETRPRPGISAWLAIGLALGWLAVLGTFVRGVGSLLTTWAATISLVLLVRGRPAVPPRAATTDQPAALADAATAESGSSTSVTAPSMAPRLPDTMQAGKAGDLAEVREPEGEQESVPGTTDQLRTVAKTPDSPTAHSPDFGPGPGPGTASGATTPLKLEEAVKTLDLRVLTAAEVASLLRVDIDTIILAIDSGELPGNRIGSHWRVDQDSLVRWLQGTYGNSVG
jgi:excisionase family DNA binding protein